MKNINEIEINGVLLGIKGRISPEFLRESEENLKGILTSPQAVNTARDLITGKLDINDNIDLPSPVKENFSKFVNKFLLATGKIGSLSGKISVKVGDPLIVLNKYIGEVVIKDNIVKEINLFPPYNNPDNTEKNK